MWSLDYKSNAFIVDLQSSSSETMLLKVYLMEFQYFFYTYISYEAI